MKLTPPLGEKLIAELEHDRIVAAFDREELKEKVLATMFQKERPPCIGDPVEVLGMQNARISGIYLKDGVVTVQVTGTVIAPVEHINLTVKI